MITVPVTHLSAISRIGLSPVVGKPLPY